MDLPLLEHHPEYHGKVTLAMVIVPSRDHVGSYAELKTRIDEEIGSINGRYSTMNWTRSAIFIMVSHSKNWLPCIL